MVDINNIVIEERYAAAAAAFHDYQFDQGYEPEDVGGFHDYGSDRFIRPIYIKDSENPDGPNIRGEFNVTFPIDSNVPNDAWAAVGGKDVGNSPSTSSKTPKF